MCCNLSSLPPPCPARCSHPLAADLSSRLETSSPELLVEGASTGAEKPRSFREGALPKDAPGAVPSRQLLAPATCVQQRRQPRDVRSLGRGGIPSESWRCGWDGATWPQSFGSPAPSPRPRAGTEVCARPAQPRTPRCPSDPEPPIVAHSGPCPATGSRSGSAGAPPLPSQNELCTPRMEPGGGKRVSGQTLAGCPASSVVAALEDGAHLTSCPSCRYQRGGVLGALPGTRHDPEV